jgi:hypothetical protein
MQRPQAETPASQFKKLVTAGRILRGGGGGTGGAWGAMLHCKPSPFGKQFCMANRAIFTSYTTFQVIKINHFSQGKCEFMKFSFVLLDKIKILTL